MIKRILVANRGEIAVRIIRACRELGIESVAVYSSADEGMLHTRLADRKICIGPPSPSKSYLDIKNIISAALITKSDAIHPGYGFLAENPYFVEEVQKNNIIFIGPPAEMINMAGNKSKAIEMMKKNNIPVVPGSAKNIENTEEALKIAGIIGFPVMIKAAFGGGGKGMRIAFNEEDIKNYFPMAKTESKNAFGNDAIYLEKYIIKPRHIEFQILADNYNNVYSPGGRECSIQRRHQKLLEEAPIINISNATYKKMEDTAVRAAKAIEYRNAGTFEFLLDADENFYFIEINTRIQVEHPVTEMVTGIDLVKQQIKIAQGEDISGTISEFKKRFEGYEKPAFGHAIEFRINAENPENDFSPSPGKITHLELPAGPSVRFDSYIESGTVVAPYYDSLLGKLIIWGSDRDEALKRSARALDEFKIEGIKTTIDFHKKILENKRYISGIIDTGFIEDEKISIKN